LLFDFLSQLQHNKRLQIEVQRLKMGKYMKKWIYTFGDGKAEGSADMKNTLGGKGANLAEMASLGLPVPPGFTITTDVCTYFYDHDKTYPDNLEGDIQKALKSIEALTGKTFGGQDNPLLVSVRSGARASMPGMMDTVLNLGLNDETVEALARLSDNPRFAYDSYRRFIQMYSDVVMGLDHHDFEEILDDHKAEKGVELDTELEADDLKKLVERYQALYQEQMGSPFPQDPSEQLDQAIRAVFSSWMNQRAITYRRLHDIPANWGTAVNVQAMVFGNLGETSATGVAFTRNPSTGAKKLYGEFLINAQGEDVVAGIRTPQDLTEQARQESGSDKPSLEALLPEAFQEFQTICQRLENHYKDMQDLEFTIENGKLWMLQTRAGKRTAKAALKIAVDMTEEGLITQDEAIARIEPQSLDQLLHPTLDPSAEKQVFAKGLPASPGAACGEIVFHSDDAESMKAKGHKVILVRVETSPEDIHGMHAAEGILTTRGGMTSHAAVVARGMGKPCVSGAGSVQVDMKAQTVSCAGKTLKAGDFITLDGASGQVFLGKVPMQQPELSGDFAQLMSWADARRRMKVRANAETVLDAKAALSFGAEGIGLCRTEHMFFDESRIMPMRRMILAETDEERRAALDALLPLQTEDFTQLFTIMQGLPVTIRLLDPPLHEFLPHTDLDIQDVARALNMSENFIRTRIEALHEFNPMLGHRGCRLAISYPDIARMQTTAILQAALDIKAKTGQSVIPEIMIPLVGSPEELKAVKAIVESTARDLLDAADSDLTYSIGTMIELPRACVCADDIAQDADFFSFGTNDLTQTALGISRDDASSFLTTYQEQGLLEQDPFVSLDQKGVGQLVTLAVEKGRQTRPDLKLGICGEHGGDPASISFFEKTGLDYISCSPYRVPIARLAAAQAVIQT
jgi:pyruvate,orthophosphate dikinase